MTGPGSAREPVDDSEDGLPRSIFVPKTDPHGDTRETVDTVLSDRFMAFLSILLLPIILLPLFVDLSSSTLGFLEACDVTIIAFFVVEYLAKLYLARDRWVFFRSPWHLLDLAVILLSFVSYLPLVALNGKGSTALLLRLLRLPRALAVGGRTAGSRMKVTEEGPAAVPKRPETIIRQVGAGFVAEREGLTWKELEEHLATKEQEWIDIHNITDEDAARLSALIRVPVHHFKSRRMEELYPHIDYFQQASFIFLQSGRIRYPERSENFLTIARLGETIICSGPKIISVSSHGTDTFKRSLSEIRAQGTARGFAVSVLYGIMDATLKEYRALFSEIEFEISAIGKTPRSRLPRDFLQRMYELNKQVVRLVSNLVHFKELLGVTISRRVPLEGFDEKAREEFKVLQDEASFLNEIADDIVENLRTLIDLYINQSSYETNRILKILAVITSLSVIPAALAGILGTNLLGLPYEIELWQLLFVTLMAMAFVGYCFYKLGWLRR